MNSGKPVPQNSIPTLPVDACRALANVGQANWRTFESQTDIGGLPHRFARWELTPGEPDFVTTLPDCRLMRDDIHALADAICDAHAAPPTEQADGGEPASQTESKDERCERLLRWLEEEQGRGERGALARVVKRDGRKRQTVSEDIEYARKKRQPKPASHWDGLGKR